MHESKRHAEAKRVLSRRVSLRLIHYLQFIESSIVALMHSLHSRDRLSTYLSQKASIA
jgi:hypothetical protein